MLAGFTSNHAVSQPTQTPEQVDIWLIAKTGALLSRPPTIPSPLSPPAAFKILFPSYLPLSLDGFRHNVFGTVQYILSDLPAQARTYVTFPLLNNYLSRISRVARPT